jgi:hypothetical protein
VGSVGALWAPWGLCGGYAGGLRALWGLRGFCGGRAMWALWGFSGLCGGSTGSAGDLSQCGLCGGRCGLCGGSAGALWAVKLQAVVYDHGDLLARWHVSLY